MNNNTKLIFKTLTGSSMNAMRNKFAVCDSPTALAWVCKQLPHLSSFEIFSTLRELEADGRLSLNCLMHQFQTILRAEGKL
jgi:hypothetical protein